MPLEKLLTMAEVAETLSINKNTLLAHIREGRIRYINIGNGTARENRRFRPADVEAFIRDQSRLCVPVHLRASPTKRRRATSSTSSMPEDDIRVLLAEQRGGIRGLLAREKGKGAFQMLRENRKKAKK